METEGQPALTGLQDSRNPAYLLLVCIIFLWCSFADEMEIATLHDDRSVEPDEHHGAQHENMSSIAAGGEDDGR